MYALITGASSGLGKSLAIKLSKMGYSIIAVSRNKNKLEDLKKEIKNIIIFPYDLSNQANIYKLYKNTSEYKIDLLVNCAGFGEYGEFVNNDLDNELNMIDLNIKALHTLTKLYLSDMVKRDSGRILNVSSSAAFQPGPLMATYYATKSYVYSLTMAIYEELRRKKSNVKISVLCPGAFDTDFFKRANIKNATYVKSVDYISDYTLKKLFKNKLIIIPGFIMKMVIFIERFLSRKFLLKMNYNIQSKK